MAFIGSCQDMCPESERAARYGLYMSIFERDQHNQPNEQAMVKEYRRSGADQEEPSPEDLRTVGALELTMNYLAENIMDDQRSKHHEYVIEWYDFLWDRLRAIRKDITQQNICDQRTVLLVERCARFHLHSCYALNRVKDFDVDMNKRNLNDCLQMLRQMYLDLKTTSGIFCDGEMEFQKYDILLHLIDDQLASTILMKTSDHRESEEMKFIFKIFAAFSNNDYYRFFKLMERADYMTSCILSLYANRMRILGLKTMTHACSAPRQATLYPAEAAIDCLGFDDIEDLRYFASTVGLEMQTKDGKDYLVLSKDQVISILKAEKNLDPIKSYRLVESKMDSKSVGQLVYGPHIDLPISIPFCPSPTSSYTPTDNTPTVADYSQTDSSRTDYSLGDDGQMNFVLNHHVQPNSDRYENLVVDYVRTDSSLKSYVQAEQPSTKNSDQLESTPINQHQADIKTIDRSPSEHGSEAEPETPPKSPTSAESESASLEDVELALFHRKPKLTREQMADLMPAGRIHVAPLASKRSTLKIPDNFKSKQYELPQKRFKTSPEARRKLQSISTRLQDENNANRIFQDIVSMITRQNGSNDRALPQSCSEID